MFSVSYNRRNKKVLWQHEFEEAVDKKPIVVVPASSIEQHGPYCSADVDISIPFFIAVSAAQQVDDFPVFVAPPSVVGVGTLQQGISRNDQPTRGDVSPPVGRCLYEHLGERIQTNCGIERPWWKRCS